MFIMSNCCQCLRCHSYSFPSEISVVNSQVWILVIVDVVYWLNCWGYVMPRSLLPVPSWVNLLQRICVWLPASLSVSLKATIMILLSVSSPTASQSSDSETKHDQVFSFEASVEAAMIYISMFSAFISKYIYLTTFTFICIVLFTIHIVFNQLDRKPLTIIFMPTFSRIELGNIIVYILWRDMYLSGWDLLSL